MGKLLTLSPKKKMQDWFSLVSFERPELIHFLSCLYNRQTGTDYNQGYF